MLWFVYNEPVRISAYDLSVIRGIPGAMASLNWLASNGDNNRPSQYHHSNIQVYFTDGKLSIASKTSGAPTTPSPAAIAGLVMSIFALCGILYLIYIQFSNKGNSSGASVITYTKQATSEIPSTKFGATTVNPIIFSPGSPRGDPI